MNDDEAVLLHVRLVEVLTAHGMSWQGAHPAASALLPTIDMLMTADRERQESIACNGSGALPDA